MRQSMEKVQRDQESKRLQTEAAIQTATENVSRGGTSSSSSLSFVDDSKELTTDEKTTETKDEETFHPSLYIPGVVLLGFEPWQSSSSPIETTTAVCVEGDFEDLREAEVFQRQPHKWVVTTGTAHALRFLEVDASPQMFMDHTTTSYYSLMDLEYSF
jgi:hypothetical protein